MSDVRVTIFHNTIILTRSRKVEPANTVVVPPLNIRPTDSISFISGGQRILKVPRATDMTVSYTMYGFAGPL